MAEPEKEGPSTPLLDTSAAVGSVGSAVLPDDGSNTASSIKETSLAPAAAGGDQTYDNNVAPSTSEVSTPEPQKNRPSTISIKLSSPAPLVRPSFVGQAKPLTQELLDGYWSDLMSLLKENDDSLYKMLEDKHPVLHDHAQLVIDTFDAFFEKEFKDGQMRVLEYLRKRAGTPLLSCRVNLKVREREALMYSPKEKCEAMLKVNPHLGELMKIFPHIDF